MPNRARKLNFLIEDDVCRDLERLVPAGKRSKLVSKALRKELELLRRKLAVEQLIESSSGEKGVSSKDILDLIAEERTSH